MPSRNPISEAAPPHRFRPADARHNPSARQPIPFLFGAVISFAVGTAAAPWVVGDLVDFFYQPGLLAVVHVFTLGWITMAMMGVMYRFVPALTKRLVGFPQLVPLQLALHVVGLAGMVAFFLRGSWPGTSLAAGAVLTSALLFAVNMFSCLVPVWRRGAAETGLLCGVSFFVLAAVLGLLLALDKDLDFLGGSMLTNLVAHAHLAGAGWITTSVCAVSYRMLPAFLLPENPSFPWARRQILGFAGAVMLLVLSLLGAIPGARLWSVLTALAILPYLMILSEIVTTRRMPLDWAIRHAIAASGWLVAAAVIGVTLAWIHPASALGSRLAAAYGAIALLGWTTNFIVGISYRLFPGFVSSARAAAGMPAVPVGGLSRPGLWPPVFFLLNGGLVVLVAGVWNGAQGLAIAGSAFLTMAGVVYTTGALWTLGFAYRRMPPAVGPLRVSAR